MDSTYSDSGRRNPCSSPIMLTSLPSCVIPINDSDDSASRSYNPGGYAGGYAGGYYNYPPRLDRVMESFRAIVTPLTNLATVYGGHKNLIEFRMRRVNRVVSLQWEPFVGALSRNGASYLIVEQSISNLPPYPIEKPITIVYKGTRKSTYVLVDPFKGSNLFIYLDISGDEISEAGDQVEVSGGCIDWITLDG